MAPNFVQLAGIAIFLSIGACSTTPSPSSPFLAELTQVEFMSLYKGCLQAHLPANAKRTSAEIHGYVAKECMRRANRTLRHSTTAPLRR